MQLMLLQFACQHSCPCFQQSGQLAAPHICYTLQFMFLKIGFILTPNWYFYKLQWGFNGAKQLVSGDTYFYRVEPCSAWILSLDRCLKNTFWSFLTVFHSLKIYSWIVLLWILYGKFCSVAIQENLVWVMYMGYIRSNGKSEIV